MTFDDSLAEVTKFNSWPIGYTVTGLYSYRVTAFLLFVFSVFRSSTKKWKHKITEKRKGYPKMDSLFGFSLLFCGLLTDFSFRFFLHFLARNDNDFYPTVFSAACIGFVRRNRF